MFVVGYGHLSRIRDALDCFIAENDGCISEAELDKFRALRDTFAFAVAEEVAQVTVTSDNATCYLIIEP